MKVFQQLFFISPNGFMPVRQAFDVNGTRMVGVGTHGWCDTEGGDDPHTGTIVGVVEISEPADPEHVIDRLEAQGIMWLPNHHGTEKIKPEHAALLAKHGVTAQHTTAEAMTIMHQKHGMPTLKPQGKKRF